MPKVFHNPREWIGARLDQRCGVYESAIRSANRTVDGKSIPGEFSWSDSCVSHSRANGHELVARIRREGSHCFPKRKSKVCSQRQIRSCTLSLCYCGVRP